VTTPPTSRRVWTAQQVATLGLTCDITTAAAVLGIGRTLAFQLLREGRFPVRVLRLGRAARVPVGDLLTLLAAPPADPDAPDAASGSGQQMPPQLLASAHNPSPLTGSHGARDDRDQPRGKQGVLPARGSREDAWTG
jgi:hypothetical protein